MKRVLYMAAITAKRHNEVISLYAQGLLDRGKKEKVAIVACMRKLLIHAQSQLKKHDIVLA